MIGSLPTSKGDIILSKLYVVPSLNAFAAVGIKYLSLDNNHEAPPTTGPTPYFIPKPIGFIIPYFKPRDAGLPSKLKPAPITAPSWANLTLFLNLAAAKSDPDKPWVSSSLRTIVPLSGSAPK